MGRHNSGRKRFKNLIIQQQNDKNAPNKETEEKWGPERVCCDRGSVCSFHVLVPAEYLYCLIKQHWWHIPSICSQPGNEIHQ